MTVNLVFDAIESDGGGYYESFNTFLGLSKRLKVCVNVFTVENYKHFSEKGVDTKLIRTSIVRKVLNRFEERHSFPIYLSDFNSLNGAHFLGPSKFVVNFKNITFSGTLWDLCHLDFPQYSEVGSFSEYNSRNYFLDKYVSRMNTIVVDSEINSLRIQKRLGVCSSKVIVLPFAVPDATFVEPEFWPNLPNKFFFYPAQLWKHKNHKNLLLAFERFLQTHSDYGLILTGGLKDKSVFSCVQKFQQLFPKNIQYLGFVDYDTISILYQRCSALVFPSFFGPTNIPPLEALNLGADVLVSNGSETILGQAARYFEPSDPKSIYDALMEFANGHVVESSVKRNFIQKYSESRDKALDELADLLLRQQDI